MRILRLLAGVWLALILTLSSRAAPPSSSPAPNSGNVTIAPLPAVLDTSMLTGSGLNTTPWPIDKVMPGGVMRKRPGTREWVPVSGLSDEQTQRSGKAREAELLRLHGSELRNIEIAIPDSIALHKLVRFGITDSCAPPCTLATRVLYRQLPQLASDSLRFWGKVARRPLPPAARQRTQLGR